MTQRPAGARAEDLRSRLARRRRRVDWAQFIVSVVALGSIGAVVGAKDGDFTDAGTARAFVVVAVFAAVVAGPLARTLEIRRRPLLVAYLAALHREQGRGVRFRLHASEAGRLDRVNEIIGVLVLLVAVLRGFGPPGLVPADALPWALGLGLLGGGVVWLWKRGRRLRRDTLVADERGFILMGQGTQAQKVDWRHIRSIRVNRSPLWSSVRVALWTGRDLELAGGTLVEPASKEVVDLVTIAEVFAPPGFERRRRLRGLRVEERFARASAIVD